MWITRCVLLVGLVVAVSATHLDLSAPLESDDVINTVKNAKTTWTAGRNFHPSMTKGHLKNLLAAERRRGGSRPPRHVPNEEVSETTKKPELPTSFDARTKWSYCSALQTVRDQGSCGSCWAVATTSVFTDRLCIASGGAWDSQLSVQYLLSCCADCGNGCAGGTTEPAWKFFEDVGLCTGGDYMSQVGCQPYTVPTCEHYVTGSRKNCTRYVDYPTPACRTECYNTNYSSDFSKDFYKVSSYSFFNNTLDDVMREIYTRGPVVAVLEVFEDFLSYKSGVYRHTAGEAVYGHAVRVIGWGVENSTKYWLVANSWNSDWGDNGYFKIIRGTNDCSIEEEMSAGVPIVN